MSYSAQYLFPRLPTVRPPRPRHRKSAPAAAGYRHRATAGCTLTHGGRRVRIGPVAFWVVVGALVVMAVWSITTGGYFAFHQNVLSRLISRQAAMGDRP